MYQSFLTSGKNDTTGTRVQPTTKRPKDASHRSVFRHERLETFGERRAVRLDVNIHFVAVLAYKDDRRVKHNCYRAVEIKDRMYAVERYDVKRRP